MCRTFLSPGSVSAGGVVKPPRQWVKFVGRQFHVTESRILKRSLCKQYSLMKEELYKLFEQT